LKIKIMLPKIKSKAFIRLLPQIIELREQGYSYEEVTAILEKQHGLILSVKQFSVYLARYKNIHAKKSAKQIAGSASTPILDQQDAQLPVNLDTQMSDYAFGSPEHKAKIQKQTEELFKSSQKIGLKRP
ncbi:hypothetical protein, partial [Acinetobacter johnsonii]|uniref:hypothetical protein n=3 Tax=Acinetobacter johnsonii TaxID=40214 RepID=UPI00376F18B5